MRALLPLVLVALVAPLVVPSAGAQVPAACEDAGSLLTAGQIVVPKGESLAFHMPTLAGAQTAFGIAVQPGSAAQTADWSLLSMDEADQGALLASGHVTPRSPGFAATTLPGHFDMCLVVSNPNGPGSLSAALAILSA